MVHGVMSMVHDAWWVVLLGVCGLTTGFDVAGGERVGRRLSLWGFWGVLVIRVGLVLLFVDCCLFVL